MKKLSVLMLALLLVALSSCRVGVASGTAPGTDIPAAAHTDPAPVETAPPLPPEHVTLLAGTHTTDQYTLTADDEGCYVTFFEEHAATKEDMSACRVGEIYFDSMADMVDSIQNNRFEEHERITMQAAFPKTDKGIKICDLNRLYDVVKPTETRVTRIALSGQYYDFVITQEGLFESGWVVYTSEEGWQRDRDRAYNWSEGATVTRDEESTFDGMPCRIVEYKFTTETYRDIYIEVEENGKKTDIVLRYLLRDTRVAPERVSDTAPWRLQIFGEENGAMYKVVIGNLLQTPTYEWFSSFGLTPYAPDAGDPATE